MRRTFVVFCAGPYHVPSLARVALFPIHLDPPTRQHRELFRLLLGAPDLAPSPVPSKSGESDESAPPGSFSGSTGRPAASSASSSSAASSSGGLTGLVKNLFKGTSEGNGGSTTSSAEATANMGTSSLSGQNRKVNPISVPNFGDADPMSCGTSSPFWYMEALATSLREDSQLAPFDDIILIPNTRGPVSLRQSTHLAALAVLATRGLAHVHVDFTSLEHPDESMPIIYELVCKYSNSVLVHWLQDAYEMLNWCHFNDFKNDVPMLLLQTQSYPAAALERQRPQGCVSRLTSRQYHSPIGSYVRSPEEAQYYRGAEQFMHAAASLRRNYPTPVPLFGGGVGSDNELRERYDSASLINRDSDYFDDVPTLPANRRRLEDRVLMEKDLDMINGVSTSGEVRVLSPSPRTASVSNSNGGAPAALRSAFAGKDRLGVNYADCAKGRWWNTPGGRGDDEVEVSRSYWNSTSVSWLGGGSATSSSLPDWMGDVETTATDKARGARRSKGGAPSASPSSSGNDAASVQNVSDTTRVGGDVSAENGAAAAAMEADRDAHNLDTVVSDDGFALAVEEQTGEASANGVVASSGKGRSAGGRAGQTAASSAAAATAAAPATRKAVIDSRTVGGDSADVPGSLESREIVDEGTRKRFLTHEIQEVREELERMLRPTAGAGAAASAPSSADGTRQEKQSVVADPSSSAKASRPHPLPFGAYDIDHEVHRPTRRRRCSVRELVEELFPPRSSAAASAATPTPTAVVGAANTARYNSTASTNSTGRGMSFGSLLHSAVKTSASHVSALRNAASGAAGNAAANNSGLYSWMDAPMVEVHPVTRTTGAEVRQALWEQDAQPSSILTDCVLRYMEGHGLYRDPRKATAATLYGGIGTSEMSGGPRCGAGGGGALSGLGGSGEMGGGAYRDSSTGGPGGSGSSVADGRTTGYRRVVPRDSSTLSFPGLIPRLELHYDHNNLLAREQYEKLRIFQCQDSEEPDLIVPIGGDGYMMHCIRKNWRRFIPFYGVNAGHVGYLLNDRSTLEELFSSPLKLHFTTMLYCQAEKEGDTGERLLLSELAFNDAWVERSSGQTALIRILVNGQERIRRLRGDGVLVSTAAGSTAYSQALGASPVPVGAPLIQVVGSNVVSPAQWRPAHLDQEDQVEFEVIDSTKRPCRCYVDSVDVGNVTRLLVRSSRVAGVTLAFSKSCDLQYKLYQMQFPKTL